MSKSASQQPLSTTEGDLVYEPVAPSRSRGVFFGLFSLLGLVVGLGLGFFYAWQINPVIERNTRPHRLREEDKINYVIAVALDYAYKSDLDRTYNLLAEVEPGQDPFQIAADTICTLIRRGRVQTSADIQVIQRLIAIFEGQPDVALSCDLSVFATSAPPTPPVHTPTPSPTATTEPAATKTSTPEMSGGFTITPFTVVTPPLTTQGSNFRVVSSRQFCNPAGSGLIEIYVRDRSGLQIPGVKVVARWNTATGQVQQSFYTGLKPERGDGYADFKMESGLIYQVSLPDLDATSDRLEARTDVCDAGIVLSYEVIFQAE
jgi:hypothetical protein